jgi:GAF domain-containing protein
VVPLVIRDRPIGAIVLYALLPQKSGFSELDRELFEMLGARAATALFAARLYSRWERESGGSRSVVDRLAR